MQRTKLAAACAALGLAVPGAAMATNGMIMEGYGPVAAGMGGAAMAYDNGTAAMANNPATLGLMADGARVDVMVGFVGPDVEATYFGESKDDAFYMPAAGYVTKQGALAWGVGIYGQGGMGTEYANGDMAQVSVGRVIFPLAYAVNKRFTIGGSIDAVWAGMDLRIDMPGTTPDIDFSDDSDYTGEAKGYSVAGKIGFTYKVADTFTVGGAYQTASNLPDLKDGAWKVEGFDMPPVLGVGFSWQATPDTMIALDVKDVMWDSSMNTVTISNSAMPGYVIPFQQDWDDQIVVALGASYRFSPALTGRVGYNYGKNPIPDQFVNYLWPAIIEDHYTAGFGYMFNKAAELNFAVSVAPEVTVTGTGAPMTMGGNGGMVIEHSQINWQLMYSHRF